jgi:hypothetical protein
MPTGSMSMNKKGGRTLATESNYLGSNGVKAIIKRILGKSQPLFTRDLQL